MLRLTQYFPFDVYAHDKKKIFRRQTCESFEYTAVYARWYGDHATITYRDTIGMYDMQFMQPYHFLGIDNIVQTNGFSTTR